MPRAPIMVVGVAIMVLAVAGAFWLSDIVRSPSETLATEDGSTDPIVVGLTGITVSPTTLNLKENDQATLTITLDSDPGKAIDVNIRSRFLRTADIKVEPDTVSWTTSNWTESRTVTVTALYDTVTEGEETNPVNAWTYNAGGIARGERELFPKTSVATTINDLPAGTEPTPPIHWTGLIHVNRQLTVVEHYSQTVTLTPQSDPGEAIEVHISSPGVASNDFTLSTTKVSWTATNWRESRTFTVSATGDRSREGHESHSITLKTYNSDDLTQTRENDIVIATSIQDRVGVQPLSLAEDGSNPGPGTIRPGLTWLPISASHTVTAIPDAGNFLVEWKGVCADVPATKLTCTIARVKYSNPVSGVFGPTPVNPTSLTGVTITVDDPLLGEGETATLSITLDSDPGEAITVKLTTDATADDLTISPTSVSWTATNWNETRTATVTAVNDTTDESKETWTVEAWPYTATSDQPILLADDVDVDVYDDVFTLTPAVSGSGTIDPSAAKRYGKDETITLTAAPDTGKHFIGWTGACASTDPATPTCTVTMDADKTATANFSDNPAAPDLMVISDGSATELDLEWKGGIAGTTKYQYRRAKWDVPSQTLGSWTNWTDVPNSTASTTTYTITGLEPYSGYHIQVRSVAGATHDGPASESALGATQYAAADNKAPEIEPGQVVEGDGTTRWRIHQLGFTIVIPDNMLLEGGIVSAGDDDGIPGIVIIEVTTDSYLILDVAFGRELERVVNEPSGASGQSSTPSIDTLFNQIAASVELD